MTRTALILLVLTLAGVGYVALTGLENRYMLEAV